MAGKQFHLLSLVSEYVPGYNELTEYSTIYAGDWPTVEVFDLHWKIIWGHGQRALDKEHLSTIVLYS